MVGDRQLDRPQLILSMLLLFLICVYVLLFLIYSCKQSTYYHKHKYYIHTINAMFMVFICLVNMSCVKLWSPFLLASPTYSPGSTGIICKSPLHLAWGRPTTFNESQSLYCDNIEAMNRVRRPGWWWWMHHPGGRSVRRSFHYAPNGMIVKCGLFSINVNTLLAGRDCRLKRALPHRCDLSLEQQSWRLACNRRRLVDGFIRFKSGKYAFYEPNDL